MLERMVDGNDARIVRRITRSRYASGDPSSWPYTLAPVAQVLREGWDLAPGVTFLVGENGSGKSTLVEAIAAAYGMNPEGGSRHTRYATRPSESPLSQDLWLERSPSSGRWAYFLRAETMHGLFTYLEENPNPEGRDPAFHEMSHGESFLAVLDSRLDTPGFYCLDEPESALSFSACLGLVGMLHQLAAAGAQVLCATHSPILASLPGATVLQLDERGLTPTAWEDLDLTAHWRRYLHDPQAYLRHLLAD